MTISEAYMLFGLGAICGLAFAYVVVCVVEFIQVRRHPELDVVEVWEDDLDK